MLKREVHAVSNQLERKYGLFTAICMVVGIVIGSGVFFKAQTILTRTGGDMPLGILAWLIGGAIMLVCLLTFAVHLICFLVVFRKLGQQWQAAGSIH